MRPAAVGAAATLLALFWLVLSVAFIYGGNVTGLYYAGKKMDLPAEIARHTRRVNDEAGYDGAYYHLMAHDPLLHRGFLAYVDNPRLRWRRIGVPGLAALLTGGSDAYADYAYVGIQLVFVFLGAWWLSRYTLRLGASAAWGLGFLLIPAVAVSLDRMTIDLPLAALSIGLIVYAAGRDALDARSRWPVYAILCAAPLVRETGVVLVAAWCVFAIRRKNWRAAALGAACAVPALAWWIYVAGHAPQDGTAWLAAYPFSGLVNRTIQGIDAPVSTLWLRAAALFEEIAMIGFWLALVLTGYLVWRRRFGLIEVTAILFAAFAAALGKFDLWASAYATGRTLSPLLIMLALLAFRDRRGFALPLLLVLPRIALQYEAQLKEIVRGMM